MAPLLPSAIGAGCLQHAGARFGVWHATVCVIGTGRRWSWLREWTGIRWASIADETAAA
jgi:hypothetical protein